MKAINTSQNGDTVLVWPGVYVGPINFYGKAITLTSATDAAVLTAPGDYAVSFYSGEGPVSVLKNFVIRGCMGGDFRTEQLADSDESDNRPEHAWDFGVRRQPTFDSQLYPVVQQRSGPVRVQGVLQLYRR